MRILANTDFPIKQKTAVAIGMFDGVHLGHMALIEDIKTRQEYKSVIYTFDRKPIRQENIFSEEEKQSIFDKQAIEYYYSREFDEAFASLSPIDFLEQMVTDFNVGHITVGFDFRFGKDAKGDTQLIRQMATQYNYTASVIPEVDMDGCKVASSLIRKMILEGDVSNAARLLGKFYFVDGSVEEGNHIGNKLGFPTANISTEKLLPAYGVYATITVIDNKLFGGVTNVGTKPTIKSDDKVNIETFLFDCDENIYDKKIRVFFVEMLRVEKRFESVEKMKEQIAIDSAAAAQRLRDLEVYKPYILC